MLPDQIGEISTDDNPTSIKLEQLKINTVWVIDSYLGLWRGEIPCPPAFSGGLYANVSRSLSHEVAKKKSNIR